MSEVVGWIETFLDEEPVRNQTFPCLWLSQDPGNSPFWIILSGHSTSSVRTPGNPSLTTPEDGFYSISLYDPSRPLRSQDVIDLPLLPVLEVQEEPERPVWYPSPCGFSREQSGGLHPLVRDPSSK